jgi:glyoxylase-like metal-dependent hydrolase (beta-lactamase superfamily II)
MQRRDFIANSALLLGAGMYFGPRRWRNIQSTPWEIEMLRPNLGVFTEKGGSIGFLVADEGITVVDAEFPEQAGHLIGELKRLFNKPILTLINTHHHGDHSSGNIAFKGFVNHVLAHQNSKTNQQRVAVNQHNEEQQLYPDQTYSDTWCMQAGKEKVCLYYMGAGHTDGDSLVHFEHANVVHMGDLLFNRRHPFIDRTAGASIHNWIKLLEKSTHKFDRKTTYIFGHAAPGYKVTGTQEDLKLFAQYLSDLLQFTEKSIQSGKSRQEFLATSELPFRTEWKGDGLERPLAAAYDEIISRQ